MSIHLHVGDLPEGIDFGDAVAVDSETMGLNPLRDRLCLVQLSAGDGTAHLVQMFDSTVIRAHVSAAGAKGGSRVRRSGGRAAGSARNSICKQTSRASPSPLT